MNDIYFLVSGCKSNGLSFNEFKNFIINSYDKKTMLDISYYIGEQVKKNTVIKEAYNYNFNGYDRSIKGNKIYPLLCTWDAGLYDNYHEPTGTLPYLPHVCATLVIPFHELYHCTNIQLHHKQITIKRNTEKELITEYHKLLLIMFNEAKYYDLLNGHEESLQTVLNISRTACIANRRDYVHLPEQDNNEAYVLKTEKKSLRDLKYTVFNLITCKEVTTKYICK